MAINIKISNLSVTYQNGVEAIQDITFDLYGGRIAALVGSNGSGKSTIFKSIMGLIKPTKGVITVCDQTIHDSQKQQLISYVPQSEEIDWSFPVSVWDTVMMGRYGHMNFLRRASNLDKEIVAESIEKVGLVDFKNTQIGELSGGQKKRVFIARSLAQSSKVLLLDEPFTGVDLKTEEEIIRILEELRHKGHLIFISTHNLGSVPEFCTDVVIIKKILIACGEILSVFTQENLAKAFGGRLRQFNVDESTIGNHDGHKITIMSDDERPLVLGKDGHLEFSSKSGKEDLIKERDK